MRLQFNDPKLPTAIPVSLHSCLVGLVFSLLISCLPLGATVIIGILAGAAAMVK
ncbi:MAG: hypothetical protein NT178_08265 [Proteobacteria bacterium]|nr:hypothetical protein [Pseudomonadota bacterium]